LPSLGYFILIDAHRVNPQRQGFGLAAYRFEKGEQIAADAEVVDLQA
jgi:hypothetical protein